ncbi:heme ABC exporter ATP-binding protein CcmA [Novosphingobium sp.]|jgi:heme exporter protein A|uniref:heme ABC exporter ATP-binding protein CcmA n=1 Tax=Novosphingobium sp. TaxID=1874826 RepID=UPI001ED2B648|nr:heme ABC exporter ATP-binding protein CcmA [Novosphingobium sp.]MBK9009511.1 heme ABC exporter ATP-binding protein CcmA [Novosphingobium sp.]
MQARRLAARDIACRRGDRLLLRGLSFALGPGEALQLAGANGTGKSSLMRILAGLLAPIAGTVEREGAIGLLDERPALDPHLPLGQALGFWQRLDGPHDNRAADLGLAGLEDVPVRYLSTGQKKRAALARLIGQQAPLWLLDEPLNGLDTRGVALVEGLVAQHCGAGGIAVIASHQPIAVPGLARIELKDFAA